MIYFLCRHTFVHEDEEFIGEIMSSGFHLHEDVGLIFFAFNKMHNTHDLTVSIMQCWCWNLIVVR